MTDWLNKTYGTNFNDEDLKNIRDFSLIWNVFENKICENSFSISRFEQKILNKNINSNLFQGHLSYFKNRYVQDDNFTPRFTHLNFRERDRKDLVEKILLGTDTDSNNTILALMIIIYRYRNNLFHGIKNMHQIDQQKQNFEVANNFLKILIDNFLSN